MILQLSPKVYIVYQRFACTLTWGLKAQLRTLRSHRRLRGPSSDNAGSPPGSEGWPLPSREATSEGAVDADNDEDHGPAF